MAWKDAFYFTRSQQRALLVLVCLVGCLFFVPYFGKYYQNKSSEELVDTVFLAEVAAFEASLVAYDAVVAKKGYSRQQPKQYRNVKLVNFDPNTLDSLGFISLGLPHYVVRNIFSYRRKGGCFSTVEAFSKVYGLTHEKFTELRPYIQLSKPKQVESVQTRRASVGLLELNAVDSLDLVNIPGIGPAYAKRILAYRKKLGGYVHVEQIREVWGIRPETVDKILSFFYADVSKVNKIAINRAGIDRLKSHPYINFYQAKAIFEYRRNKGVIQSIEECKKIDDESLTPEFWVTIGPYLEF